MAEVKNIEILEGQRDSLLAPADRRKAVYCEQVMEPLRPLWEHIMSFMPAPESPGSGEENDPALAAARLIGLYGPDSGTEEGLAALSQLEESESLADCVRAQESAIEALAPREHGLDFDGVTFALALADPRTPDLLERHAGYMGGGSFSDWILVYVWPTDYNLPRLPAISVHELHHKVRLAFEPWDEQTMVGQYLVLEGLAEAFAAERFGEELLGPWTKALSEEELERARPVMREALEVTGFNEIRGYIFGDWAAPQFGYEPRGLPDFVGYSMGYRVVREYLQHTGRSAVEASYVPWREIVEGSRYF
jgi:uncharacterized protein YjaZ